MIPHKFHIRYVLAGVFIILGGICVYGVEVCSADPDRIRNQWECCKPSPRKQVMAEKAQKPPTEATATRKPAC